MRQSVRGITLVEVLVVTGTLGLLAALLVPVLTQARATARTLECTSNLRQWGIALNMYMNHNDGAIPRAARASSRSPRSIAPPTGSTACLPTSTHPRTRRS